MIAPFKVGTIKYTSYIIEYKVIIANALSFVGITLLNEL